MKIHSIAFEFLEPFCDEYVDWVQDPGEADFILTMNSGGREGMEAMGYARSLADKYDKPLCWWTIEDPNAYAGFVAQARLADYVFTSDRACIPFYRRDCRHDRVFWLPLAASEKFHRPLPLREDATDGIFTGNWYDTQWEARRWGVQTVILPLAEAGYSITCFSLDEPPYPILLREPNRWIGPTDPRSPGYYGATAEQYTWGKVALGVNNQRSGMDGRGETVMTSMRTFEVLACGKPFLAAHSDAYEALGLSNALPDAPGKSFNQQRQDHMCWVTQQQETLDAACWLTLGRGEAEERWIAMAERGRAFVLANHTYGHRMRAIMEVIG